MIKAVLFDLDGTLLDIDLGDFISRYFRAIGAVGAGTFEGLDLVAAISASTEAMMARHDGRTNREAFYADFLDRTGVGLKESWEVFEPFYREDFPSLRAGASAAEGGQRALETARSLGLRVAIATNPIFPMLAIEHRLRWAGVDPESVDVITSYESMHACKPHAAYFRETAAMLGVEPSESVMVGDDRTLDLPAGDVGMTTFYVGREDGAQADYRGTLEELAALLPRLVDRGV